MTRLQLLTHSLRHYWRTNLAVLLGVIAGTAVIGGALIVGDSVKGSLRQMTYDRLGRIDHVLTGPHFFREQLARDLAADAKFQERFSAAAPALVLTGGFEHRGKKKTSRRVGTVNVFGTGPELWRLVEHGDAAVPANDEVILNQRVAEQLDAKAGDAVTLWIELPATVPRDSLLGNRDTTSVEVPLTVKAVLPDEVHVSRLNLNPNQQLPLNAFVSLGYLQEKLELHERRIRDVKRRRIVEKPARINTIFFAAKRQAEGESAEASEAADALISLVKKKLKLADLYLRVAKNKAAGTGNEYLSLESAQQILGEEYGRAGIAGGKSLNLTVSPVLVYLANELIGPQSDDYARYSIVAGVDFRTMQKPPFGPLQFVGPRPNFPLGKRDILINDWLAKNVRITQPGATLRLKFHVVGAHILGKDGRLPEEEATFTVAGIVKLEGTVAEDRGFTPEVEGITDVDSFDEWKKPFPMKNVTEKDDEFWRKYRATPKAFVSLDAAQELWRSRYGKLTSVRASKLPGKSLEESAAEYTAAVLKEISPEATGLVVRPVKYEGLQAASGTTNFAGYFIAFSFFLIASATILIGMLFRLGIEQRSSNVGLLQAVGYSPQQVRRLFLAEGGIVVVLGGLLGVAAAYGYASLMVYGLKTWWIGAIGTRFLDVYVTPRSLGIGFAASVAVSLLAVWWGLRYLRKLSTRELLAGATDVSLTAESQRTRGRRSSKIAIAAAAIAGLLVVLAMVGLIPSTEAFSGFSWQVVAFFIVGIALLVAGLTALSAWLDADKTAAVHGRGIAGEARLGMRNAARHRQRSVMTVALIASATFVIVAVAAGHRNPAAELPDKDSGNGGFTLVAQSSTPLLHDLNTKAGREKLGLDFTTKIRESRNQPQGASPRLKDSLERKQNLLERMTAVSFRVQPGDDASCLNIYQTRVPTILGVPPTMIDRGGFKFIGAKTDNPWTLLTEKYDGLPRPSKRDVAAQDGLGRPSYDHGEVPVYPVFGDMNTLQYSLHKGVGDFVSVPNDANPTHKLKIVGMFDGSVFQGVLLLSEANFQKLYPQRAGYEYFLIAIPADDPQTWRGERMELEGVLESGLTAYGFDTEPVADRLANFLAVQNTYLSTFQTLGGLGLLLGTLGLATVMLRNVLERRSEFALLRAVGFRNSGVSALVVVENAFLLIWGLLAGTVSALLAMTPHLTSTGADVPWTAVGWILLGVFAVGMIAALVAVWEAVRTPIVATLRSE
jgi:ABC-type antimicrobial peptide transport system permease subunit